MAIEEIKIPDIGGEEAEVIELLVKPGDKVAAEDGLISLESDKATMDVPAPMAGVIKSITVKVGDKVNEGVVVASIETDAAEKSAEDTLSAETSEAKSAQKQAEKEETNSQTTQAQSQTTSSSNMREHVVKVPDIGGEPAEVIEVLVKPGDSVAEEEGLVSLESDKATMDVPAPFAGKIESISVKVGDKVSEGSEIALVITASHVGDDHKISPTATSETVSQPKQQEVAPATSASSSSAAVDSSHYGVGADIHASPAVRRIAREFGVNLRQVQATGDKGRITVQDVQRHVKSALAGGGAAATGGLNVAAAPKVDFSKFGEVEELELNKIKRLTAKNLHRNWVTIPHVTQFDEADISEMEAFRQQQKKLAEKEGVKLTPLVFIMKAVVAALKEYPQFNSSLDASGDKLIMKKYFHIGVAVDTTNGLVVPVVRDVNRKGMFDLARELAEISKKARDKKLKPQDMQGACFSISSLGGIGGTNFTPIVNLPEVAILGVSRAKMQPVYFNNEFMPRLMLPLALSYDHRVIDGAEAARFTTYLSKCLSDIRRLLL